MSVADGPDDGRVQRRGTVHDRQQLPRSQRSVSGTSLTHARADRAGPHRSSGTRWTTKNLIDFRNGQRATTEGNAFETDPDGFRPGWGSSPRRVPGTARLAVHTWTTLVGDGDIVARVASVSGTQAWTTGGVMMRMTFDAGAPQAFMLMSIGTGRGVPAADGGGGERAPQRRIMTPLGESTCRGAAPDYRVASSDGRLQPVGSDTFSIGDSLFVGLGVSSHDSTSSQPARSTTSRSRPFRRHACSSASPSVCSRYTPAAGRASDLMEIGPILIWPRSCLYRPGNAAQASSGQGRQPRTRTGRRRRRTSTATRRTRRSGRCRASRVGKGRKADADDDRRRAS